MMKHLLRLAGVVAVSGLAVGCTVEAGGDSLDTQYGVASKANFDTQDAYNQSRGRLRDLAADFRTNTQDTVTFAFNRSNLDAQARRALDGQAAWLRENPSVRMTVLGHTDLVGSNRYNRALGLRRARAVVRYLSRRGISRKRLDAVASRGESEPVVQTEARERRNRRTVTTVAGFARNFVGTGIDGEYAARIYDSYQAGSLPRVGIDDAGGSSDISN